MFRQIGTGEIVVIVVVLLLLFGAQKLPDLARSIGASAREFRKGISEAEAGLTGDDGDESAPDAGAGAADEEDSDG